MFSKRFQCCDRYCCSEKAYLSRRRNFLEKYVLPLFLLRPVRCASCFRRSYVHLWVHVPARKSSADLARKAAASAGGVTSR